jgi:hypothetical protein
MHVQVESDLHPVAILLSSGLFDPQRAMYANWQLEIDD